VTRSGCIGNVAAPDDWSLVRVGSLLPSSDKRASITCLGNVNVSNLTNVSGSSVIGGPDIEEFDGIGRLSSLVALFTRVRDCEPRASESSTGSAIWA
jgi:hypothetical protein